MSKKSHFRGCFEKQYGKRVQTLLKSSSEHLYHIHWSQATKLCSRKSLLLTSKILGLLVKTLAADENHLVLHRDNLTIPTQTHVSRKKRKKNSEFSTAFLKCTLNFNHFEEKDDPQCFCISEMTDSENVVIEMCKKFRFRGDFEKQNGKRAQRLL